MVDVEALIGIARRQWRVVALASAAGIALGLAYIVTAVPIYTSSINVLIDRGNGQLANQLSSIGDGSVLLDDEASVLSQVEVFGSDTIALAVVDKLDLMNDPNFNASSNGLLSSTLGAIRSVANISNWFGADSSEPVDEEVARQNAARRLVRSLEVTRVGRTYVLEIEYSSPSADLAAKIANAFGDAYLIDKLNSKYEATRRASGWLQERIAELRQRSLDTDLAVQRFRTANGLVAAGSVLVADQQLSELNSALIVAQSDTARAQARLEQIQQIVTSGVSDAIVTDVLGSSVSNELRQKYLDASRRQAQISARLGENHAQAVRLRGEMAEYQRLMFEELSRIAESYKSDLDVARAREKALAESVAQATGISASANETQVQLRELEREAETYKNLYQTFLQRYQEAVQRQSFPVTEARVITRATPSGSPSEPKKPMVLALFVALGAAIGSGIGAYREFRDRFFRTGDQVRESLNAEFLGMIPLVPTRNSGHDGITESKAIAKSNPVMRHVLDQPLSSFAETLRSAKLAVDLALTNRATKIIGVVSSLPGEGKSTVAVNFAQLLANQGNRTILVDGDLRNPGATRAIGRHADAGLLEALLDRASPSSVFLHDPVTRLGFLPAVIRHRVPHSSELLASASMRNLLQTLSGQADYIVVDLPPLGPVVDARAIASQIDGFIFVAEWGRTARKVAKQLLDDEHEIRGKCLGVILNKVDQEKMKLYRSYGSSEYYHSRYASYYREA
ncbi:polysaccharide biosynthesis tyrosine autokinase [Rhizobium sp. NFR07]|uniref:polysaccharide biosynthesis tyrosine autokinase n=1 Tax=Rhizobium sp. NFR07 TaxID=1566262 RepID=UPI000B8784BB|nr:polysaccharide biosynthesis tyrosine autokinase [Rhizobium sp. NFR07]